MAKSTKTVAAVDAAQSQPTITAYKGFGLDWKCRDFAYEVGKSYKHTGSVKACDSGFHACEYPLDVFAYYSPASSCFAVVEQAGVLSRHDGDSKVASSKITIKAEINFAGLIKAAIEYTTSRCKPVDPMSPASATGYLGAAMASGYEGRAKGIDGNALFLIFRDDNYNIVHARAAIVGRDGIKADVFYALDAEGNFQEVSQ